VPPTISNTTIAIQRSPLSSGKRDWRSGDFEVKTNKSLLLAGIFVFAGLHAREALAYHFGADPLNDVMNAAENYNACPQHLKTEQLVALMLSPTWWEVADQNANNTPSPMTLGRHDNGNALYLPGQWMARAPYRRAFWHPGIGVWELDDRFKGSNLSIEKFSTNESAPMGGSARVVAQDMSTTYCNHYNKDETIPLYWVFSPYCACASDGACNKYHRNNPDTANCNYTYYRLLSGAPVSLIHYTQLTVMGVESLTPVTLQGCQVYLSLASWSIRSIVRRGISRGQCLHRLIRQNANPPLALPFYVFYQHDLSNNIQYEWRYWMLEDTFYGQDYAARREYGVGSSEQLQWFPPGPSSAPVASLRASNYGLCDETIVQGACGHLGLSVSLAVTPTSGPAP